MMKLVIPDNNDPKLPKAVKRQLERPSNHKIGEIYGKPTKSKYIGSGRANLFFDDLSNFVFSCKDLKHVYISFY